MYPGGQNTSPGTCGGLFCSAILASGSVTWETPRILGPPERGFCLGSSPTGSAALCPLCMRPEASAKLGTEDALGTGYCSIRAKWSQEPQG